VAKLAVSTFVTTSAKASPVQADVKPQMKNIASGAIIAELQNEAQELQSNGWKMTGTPTVSKIKVVSEKLKSSPPTAVISACVDSSGVKTLDSSGRPLQGKGDPTDDTATNIFTLQQEGSAWRVTARTFPDNPSC